MKETTKFPKSLIAAAIVFALPGTAMAQLEEVIVTATKRVESAQDIPVSIEVFSGETLDSMGIGDLGD